MPTDVIQAVRAATLALKAEASALRFHLAASRLRDVLAKANFDPNQPRAPRGRPDGGQWVKVPGWASDRARVIPIADEPHNDGRNRYSIDLVEEEMHGGHTIAAHVGRSAASLLARVRGERYVGLIYTTTRKRDGSFPSVVAANKLVNATLAQNRAIVDEVATGRLAEAFITAEFRSQTGIEAFRPSPNAGPYLRDTFGVGVVIVHDPVAANGYRVITAYPRNE